MTDPTTPTPVTTLECDHCGGDAIESADGLFGECSGVCMTCGMPGRVSVDDADDEDVTAYWVISDDPNDKCNEKDCETCHAE